MASIGITVENGLFNIALDQYEWTGLTVNGNVIPEENNQWKYAQSSKGLVQFTATANLLTAVNPGGMYALKGENGKDYVCVLYYTNDPFTINGVLFTGENIAGAQTKPIGFNQGMMAGEFSVVETLVAS